MRRIHQREDGAGYGHHNGNSSYHFNECKAGRLGNTSVPESVHNLFLVFTLTMRASSGVREIPGSPTGNWLEEWRLTRICRTSVPLGSLGSGWIDHCRTYAVPRGVGGPPSSTPPC